MQNLTWGNCLNGILYLYMRGKVGEIIYVNSHIRWWPYHYLALNKRGQVLHFKEKLGHHNNTFAPFLYQGKFGGISRGRQEEVLRESGRYIIYRTNNVKKVIIKLLLIYVILFIPFFIMWTLYPFINLVFCLYDAITKRKTRKI